MTTASPRRRARARAIVAGLAGAITLVIANGSPAGAAVSVTPPAGGTVYVDTEVVTVSGTNASFPTATHVAVVQCDVTTGVVAGTRCSNVSATSFIALSGGTYSIPNFVLDQAWTTSWNYTVNPPTSSATAVSCATIGGRDCAVFASYYRIAGGPPTHLGAESYDLTY